MDWLVEVLQVDVYSAEAVTAVATSILAILALFTLIAIIYVGFVQLGQIRSESHKQLIMSSLENWNSQEMIESKAIVAKIVRASEDFDINKIDKEQIDKQALHFKEELLKLENTGDKEFFQIVRIGDYWECVGYMMKSTKDREIIKELFGDAVITYYNRFQPWICEKRRNFPAIYEYFEKLYEFCNK